MADIKDWLEQFPPGCTCERINTDTSADVPGTRFVRGPSDPPCRVHWPAERNLYDTAHQRGYDAGYADGVVGTYGAQLGRCPECGASSHHCGICGITVPHGQTRCPEHASA